MTEKTGAAAQVDGAARAALRALPRVDDLLACPTVAAASGGVPRSAALEAVRGCVDAERSRILAGGGASGRAALETACAAAVADAALPHLRCAVNATGVVVHTNLGRAPLSERVADHVADVARHYSNLEFDVETGARGSRHDHVADLVCRLTGAEDAAVVNNNAAAVMIVLSEFARGREAVVSRGELIEIGGSFRIPDIMELSGARMVEVGTTNKTHLSDFERALTTDTALVLKVHPSNYRVVGFHEEVGAAELAGLAHAHGALVYEDQGSGTLVDLAAAGIGSGEHTPGWSLAQGVDLVSFSGDKLLGAGQAGVIVGSRALVARIKKNPLMRAVRPDKMTLAALEGTLRAYLDGGSVWDEVPVLRMLGATPGELRAKACALLGRVDASLRRRGIVAAGLEDGELRAEVRGEDDPYRPGGAWAAGEDAPLPGIAVGGARLTVEQTLSCVGGGALPTVEMLSFALSLRVDGMSPNALRGRLVARRPRPVVARVADDALVCDVRTLVDARDEDDVTDALADAVAAAASGRCEGGVSDGR